MNKYLKSCVLILLASFYSGAFAGGWQSQTKVKEFLIEGADTGDRIYVMFDNNFNPDSCTENSGHNRIDGSNERGKYVFSTILSAKAAGQTVIPALHGCDDWNRPIVTGVWVK